MTIAREMDTLSLSLMTYTMKTLKGDAKSCQEIIDSCTQAIPDFERNLAREGVAKPNLAGYVRPVIDTLEALRDAEPPAQKNLVEQLEKYRHAYVVAAQHRFASPRTPAPAGAGAGSDVDSADSAGPSSSSSSSSSSPLQSASASASASPSSHAPDPLPPVSPHTLPASPRASVASAPSEASSIDDPRGAGPSAARAALIGVDAGAPRGVDAAPALCAVARREQRRSLYACLIGALVGVAQLVAIEVYSGLVGPVSVGTGMLLTYTAPLTAIAICILVYMMWPHVYEGRPAAV